MFLRTHVQRKGDRDYTYLRVVESYREGGRVRQRTLLSFGNVENWPKDRLGRLIRLLGAATGEQSGSPLDEVRVLSSMPYGPGLALDRVWRSVGMPELIACSLSGRHPEFEVAEVVEAMALNRLMEPRSKLGVSSWAARSYCGGLPLGQRIPVQHLYRALDYLTEAKESLEEAIYRRVSDLFTLDVSLVFYDITSSYFEGSHSPLAKRGYSRDHRPDLMQIELGLVVNPEGIPICHEVFAGNLKDEATVPGIVRALGKRFNIAQVVFVGDSGMLSDETLRALGDAKYEYILAQKLRRNGRLPPVIARAEKEGFERVADNLWVGELESGEKRLIGCYNPIRAKQDLESREARLSREEEFLAGFAEPRRKGQARDPEKVRSQIRKRLDGRRLGKFFEWDYQGEGDFRYRRNKGALSAEERLDGLLVLETTSKLPAVEIARSYRMLSEIEESFREIKSFVRIRPIRHYADPRVRGHVMVCVLAYLMEQLMEKSLTNAGLKMTAQAALEELKSLHLTTLELDGERVRKPTELKKRQSQILKAVGVEEVPRLLAC